MPKIRYFIYGNALRIGPDLFLIVFPEGPARGREWPARASRAGIGRFSGPVFRIVRGTSWINAKLSLTGNFLDNLSVLYRADLIVFISPYE